MSDPNFENLLDPDLINSNYIDLDQVSNENRKLCGSGSEPPPALMILGLSLDFWYSWTLLMSYVEMAGEGQRVMSTIALILFASARDRTTHPPPPAKRGKRPRRGSKSGLREQNENYMSKESWPIL